MFEPFRDVYSVWNKHIVTFQDNLSVNLHGREGVETIENEFMNLAVSCRSNLWKFCPVGPTLVRDPFTFELVKSKKGIRDAVS
jgi:hypothetical protein